MPAEAHAEDGQRRPRIRFWHYHDPPGSGGVDKVIIFPGISGPDSGENPASRFPRRPCQNAKSAPDSSGHHKVDIVTKVVITGMGCVSGLGPDRASAWRTLMAGDGGIRPLKKFAQGQQELSFEGIGASVPPEATKNLTAHFTEKQLSGVDPFSSFAAAATLEALEDAGLWGAGAGLSEAAIVYGSASGGNASIEAAFERRRLASLDAVRHSRPLSCRFERLFVLSPRDTGGHAPDPRPPRLGCGHRRE
jgi:hypothetical protein